jgi:SAM-dependent methyltransferase
MSEVPVRVPDEWFVGFHQGLAARFWRAAAAAMADDDMQVVRRLLPDPPASVLDVPCGDGRLTTRLAAAGYAVTGVDLIASEVEYARRAAQEAGVDARFEVGDLRALPDVGRVDAIVSWGNAFGYLVPAETARSLAGMRAALRPGGRLVLESLTVAESLLAAGVKPSDEWEYGGVRLSATTTTASARAGSRATSRSRTPRATSSTPARRTTSTPAARSCACWSRPASARSSSWAATGSSRTRSARHG